MKTGLLLIDIQNDYFKGGKLELYHAEQAVKNAKKILDLFREKNLPIIHIQHINLKKEATFFIKETEGVKIHDDVCPLPDETIIIKHAPNSFYNTDLQTVLVDKKIEQLVVCGMMSHMCIDTTVRCAKDFDYHVTLIEDACTTKDLVKENEILKASLVHKVFMASLDKVFAKVCTTEQLIKIGL